MPRGAEFGQFFKSIISFFGTIPIFQPGSLYIYWGGGIVKGRKQVGAVLLVISQQLRQQVQAVGLQQQRVGNNKEPHLFKCLIVKTLAFRP